MNAFLFTLIALLCLGTASAFMAGSRHMVKSMSPSNTLLMACRRNNKTEKRKRNREYARKFANKAGGSRRKQVVEEKRLVVAKSEDVFQAEVFKMTTDDDMPAYSGFDFLN